MILTVIKCVVIAYAYCNILTAPGMLLDWLYYRITEFVNRNPDYEFYFKPIILCNICVTGQFVMWSWFFTELFPAQWYITGMNGLFYIALGLLLQKLLNQFVND